MVEGVRLAEEALQAGWNAQLIFFTQDLDERGHLVVQGFAEQGAQVELVDQNVFQAASDTITPQGILVVLPMRSLRMPEDLDFAFISDAVRDPGNLGTMLRTAAAAGVDAFFLPSGVVDPYSPKVVRAAMGAHFRIPILTLSWEEVRAYIDSFSLHAYLAAAGEGEIYTQADFCRPLALIVGGEAQGAGLSARKLADGYVQIPMPGKVESLNTAVAAAILMFEVVRQRSSP